MNEKSGHWTNTGMAKFINDNLYNYKSDDEKSMNPFRWYRLQNGDDVSKYRETINGFPCRLILINDGSTPLNEGQNEPTPGNTKDMGIFNFNHDKDATTTLGFDSDIFPNCASYEVTANSDTSAGAFMSYDAKNSFYIKNTYDREYTGLEIPIEQLIDNGVINISFDADLEACYIRYTNATNVNISQLALTASETYSLTPPDEATHVLFIFVRNRGTDSLSNFTMYINNKAIEVIPGEEQSSIIFASEADELAYLKESFELRHPDADDVAEDWGFMGVETDVYLLDYFDNSSDGTRRTEGVPWNGESAISATKATRIACYGTGFLGSVDFTNGTAMPLAGTTHTVIIFPNQDVEDFMLNGRVCLMRNKVTSLIPIGTLKEEVRMDPTLGLKALIDWVDNCTDEEFIRDFEQHFHKDYTLRYFCLVTLIGAVDNLGKNMMLDTADNKIYFPRFYDIDTICSYDNSGQLKFDVDIEMEQGYWNTSSSRLWTRIRDLMHNDIVTTYNNMRQNGVSYENMMHYIYDEQIAKIPQTYYNKDYDIKYAPFADSYIGMAHGDTYEHVKRWLKQRFTFVDTLFDYEPSYNNDVLTIRANTTELMTLEIETYTPVYQHVSWYNGQMDKKKIDGKVSVEFSGTAQAATDQEVLIYGGSNVKSIKGITSMNPNRMLIGSATKLVEIDAHDCPLLADINANKANLSPHEYLNKVDLSNCPLLEGNLRLNNSPLVQEINIKGTNITGMNLPSSIRNLQILRLPNTMTELTLNDASMLHTLEFDEGVNLQSISMTNCNALENLINFDLLQTPSITLNNSYNNVAELYFKDTTNLSLNNMPNLERVIFTPNNEYETFELINVANAPNYTISTFNCPKLSTFMTTAPYRESYMVNAKYLGFILPGKTRTELEYIQSDGNQYFDVGIMPKAGDIIVMDLDMDKRADTNYDYFIGGNAVAVQFNDNSDTQLSVRNCTISPRETPVGDVPVCNVSKRNTYTVNITVDEGHTLKIFAGAYQGTFETNQKGAGKLYSFKYYSNNSLIRDYIPCKDEDDIVCLYDNITNKFLYPDGTLIAGSEVDVSDKLVEIWDKDYGDIQPNTTFTANSIDISSTQFTDVKLLCTTDINTLKLPTTIKNFYCDSSLDLDTDYLEDGEYDVVHGELVEPYTTDYEGEVEVYTYIEDKTIDVWEIGYSLNEIGALTSNSGYKVSEYLKIKPGSKYKIPNMFKMVEFSDIGVFIKTNNSKEGLISDSTNYIRIVQAKDIGVSISYFGTKTPNLIPSSADGSLIFSMYAPSNTVAPASGTWDLKGLKFDNFHTFGMNNDVVAVPIYQMRPYIHPGNNSLLPKPIPLDSVDKLMAEVRTDDGSARTGVYLYGFVDSEYSVPTSVYGNFISDPSDMKAKALEIDPTTKYLSISHFGEEEGMYLYINGDKYLLPAVRESADTSNTIWRDLVEHTSLSMPARYDDYNISIRNAYIAPKTHNTMLYPLLVNEDNPITGTLDYTNYEGKHLSWSFAYTDEEFVDIIQPKEELINSYEYRYNAFYDTEYEFDNPYEIARYTSSASGVLPTFNTEFTYTYDETDNGDGTYTTKVYADSLDNLPTSISFNGKTTLLIVDKLNTSKVTNMTDMFYGCSGLTSLNLSGFDTSKVTSMYHMFCNCRQLTSLDLSGLDTGNVTNMADMFYGCSGLTSLDLSGFDTSNVTSINQMFRNCYGLTSLDLSGFDTSNITNMSSMFQSCTGLTSLDVSGFDTSNVINMSNMFNDCRSLTSLDLSGFDTSKVTNMSSMFYSCNSLTSLNLSKFDTSKVTAMNSMFFSCNKLIELDSMQNISASLDLSTTILDATSLLDVIDNLATVTSTKTLTLSATLLAKLTEDQIAIATNKGWTVS